MNSFCHYLRKPSDALVESFGLFLVGISPTRPRTHFPPSQPAASPDVEALNFDRCLSTSTVTEEDASLDYSLKGQDVQSALCSDGEGADRPNDDASAIRNQTITKNRREKYAKPHTVDKTTIRLGIRTGTGEHMRGFVSIFVLYSFSIAFNLTGGDTNTQTEQSKALINCLESVNILREIECCLLIDGISFSLATAITWSVVNSSTRLRLSRRNESRIRKCDMFSTLIIMRRLILWLEISAVGAGLSSVLIVACTLKVHSFVSVRMAMAKDRELLIKKGIGRSTLFFLREQASFGPSKLEEPRRRYSAYVTLRDLTSLCVQPTLVYEANSPTGPVSSPSKRLLYIYQICSSVCAQYAIFAGCFVPLWST